MVDESKMELERQRAEEYKKWKKGSPKHEEKKGIFGTSDLPYGTHRLGSATLLEQWQLKAGISGVCTLMLLIPYFSYWLWFVLLPPLRVIVPSSPSLQLDVFSGNFYEHSLIWGEWWLDGAGGAMSFLPSFLGFLLFFTYFYFLSNIFIPEYKWRQHAFISILWIWFFISWAIGIPPSPFEWLFLDI